MKLYGGMPGSSIYRESYDSTRHISSRLRPAGLKISRRLDDILAAPYKPFLEAMAQKSLP